MTLTAEEINKMEDEELAALETAVSHIINYFAWESRKRELAGLSRLVNNICLERSIDTEYYSKRYSDKFRAAYNRFRVEL